MQQTDNDELYLVSHKHTLDNGTQYLPFASSTLICSLG